jgi:uncharacterized protein (DUF488 family)
MTGSASRRAAKPQTRKGSRSRMVREGAGPALFTIGYEKRSPREFSQVLRKAGIDYLADVRLRPMSRKPGFAKSALAAACARAGIEYGPWPQLGSPQSLRDKLHAGGSIRDFLRGYRAFATRGGRADVAALAELVKRRRVALLCFEREHDECHRSVLAGLIADQTGARVLAIP